MTAVEQDSLAFALDDFCPEMSWTRNMLLAGRISEAEALDNLNNYRIIQLSPARPWSPYNRKAEQAEAVLRRFGYFGSREGTK